MKILAIRGKNLASLSSEFVVDFQSEPLASAGLFAITGPTGSGKSTLLDALCLALYEKTPRLTSVVGGHSGDIPDVGDNGIAPGDVRTILRRGAATGFAEVDFVGSDSTAYRSRWTVRRAYSKAEGRLQTTEICLTRIEGGQVLGDHRKTETLRLIEACIGLTFEQFTRTVLLAQNHFSVFLKAPDDDRAELLQTLTGTETFSAISIQAFERMKVEKQQLLHWQAQLKEQAPFSPEIRIKKDTELHIESNKYKDLEQQKSLWEDHLRWYQEWDKHKAAEANNAHKLEAATTEKQTAAPRYQHLALLDQVQPSRRWWDEQLRLLHAVNAATKAAELAKGALATSQTKGAAYQAGHTTALHQQALADTAKTDAQSAIDLARGLDANIAAIIPQLDAAIQSHKSASEHLKFEKSRQLEAQRQIDAAKTDLAAAQQWLVENTQLRSISEGWPRWEVLFAQAQRMLESQSKAAIEAAALEITVARTKKSVSTATIYLSEITKTLEINSVQLKVCSQKCTAVDIEKLSSKKIALEQTRDEFRTASQLWQRRIDLQKQQQKQTDQRQTLAKTLAESDIDLQEGLQKRPFLERELQATEEALNLAVLAASENAGSMRTALQTDKECPVCGSIEHPYVANTPARDAVLNTLKDLVKAKRKALRELENNITTARTAKANDGLSIGQIALRLAQLESEMNNLNLEWDSHALHTQINRVPELDRAQWLMEGQDRIRSSIEQLSQQEALYRDALKRKDVAQTEVNMANTSLAKAKEDLNSLDAQYKDALHASETVCNQNAEIGQQLLRIENQIDSAFLNQNWRSRWHENPVIFVQQCRASADAWSKRMHSTATLSSKVLAFEGDAYEKPCLQAIEQLKIQENLREKVASSLNTCRTHRSTLFRGDSIAKVEAGLNAAIQATKLAVAESQTTLYQAQAEITRNMEAVRQSEKLLEQHCIGLKNAVADLDTWLVNFNKIQSPSLGGQTDVALDRVEFLLQTAPEWIIGEREALQKLEHTLTVAQTEFATCKQFRIAHEFQKTAIDPLGVLQENFAKISVVMDSVNEALFALKHEIAKDNERLGASQSLRATIDKQTVIFTVWSKLSDLIGSADGKKFRNFAQQLTLDILLSYGNKHLQSLTRRYRLERIKDSLGLLVVDQEMGDEMRSVHSLSGGESFLVSLALALGLASLSSHRVQVESLFIDEGFGSLDEDSLGIAINALGSLQSQGRKVGVISHIQEMTERIGTQVQVQRLTGGLSRILVC